MANNLYVKAVPPPDLNKNTEWFMYLGVWTTYILILFFGWLLILSVSSCSPGVAWTVVNLSHFLVTYHFFHWKKGTPFADDQGIYNGLTWWEQMDNGKQLTRNRKFLTVVSVVLYLVASHATDYQQPMLFLNTLAVIVLVVAKFPNMHKVRIFGINADKASVLGMEGDGHFSVSSPRKIVSISRRRRIASASDDDGASPLATSSSSGLKLAGGVSSQHSPKTYEVYGFVGAITTVVATVTILVWAYLPESWLHSIGIFYYPDRYWALAMPTYVMVTIILALTLYIGLNFMSTPPPSAMNTIFDEFSREPMEHAPFEMGEDKPIDPISDIGIDKINSLMFVDAH